MGDVRRSSRSHKPNARYTQDPLEGVDFDDEPEDGRQFEPLPLKHKSGHDFDANDAQDNDDEDEYVAERRDSGKSRSYNHDDDSVDEDGDTNSGAEEVDLTRVRAPKEITLNDGRKRPLKEDGKRSRLLFEFHKGSHERRLHSFYGRDEGDYKPASATRNISYPYPTLPARRLIQDLSSGGPAGGMAYSLFHPDEARKLEGTTGWNWYYEHGGRSAFQERQYMKSITVDEALPYVAQPAHKSINLLLGPFREPQLYNLRVGKSMRLKDSWPLPKVPDPTYKNGWLLNVGRRIQGIEWIPNRNSGTQYLCISMLRQQIARPPPGVNTTSAFRPGESHKDTFELWAFDIPPTNGPNTPVLRPEPRLAMTICTDWGYLKEFKWCPCLKHKSRKSQDDPKTTKFGLLAGIWSDGALRVLDLSSCVEAAEPQYLHISRAAFEVRIPGSVCTSLTWLSSNVIAASGADGTVSIWDISQVLRCEAPQTPKPFFYELIHDTYILSISSAYPSHPHLVTTTSMDGFFYLFDIRSPKIDKSWPPRSRIGPPTTVWSDHCQGWLSPDDHCLVKLFSMRRVFSYVAVGRGDGIVGCLATSPVHLSALMGTHSGHVHVTNPERKIFDSRTLAWQQTWFLHEWKSAQCNEDESDATMADDDDFANGPLHHKPDSKEVRSKPLVRITEGYNPVEVQMNGVEATADGDDFDASFTIHEEQTAITSTSWNPNLNYGGWAAAGMGSGLVRVEDISI
ncbi:hypothetical protein EJ05DRAFT_257978 [Pseudovirgaria hyperparasitica]|uniref:WD40 repeat-like protein n=1 Tax=Pseudovirgaria hyperparasitica TaxID=470096 RepID=A0A6A6WEL6_9PEZI|nr:uncharacterized protein EJ05DRAFT_257978 [Pseudovirgaria hyperparasitica]KAF2761268.1 hypothetical protein EJ05DRAFT_257978 [Pseudovirgaria hyperparasitica]